MAAPVSGTQWELAIAQEATFGTAITATTTDLWKLLHLVGVPEDWNLSGIVRDFTMRPRGSRVPHNTDYFTTVGGGEVIIPFTALATDITLDYLLYGVMQDFVSEGATPPYAKIWEWDASTTQPDFAANAGRFYTVVLKNPLSSEDMIATSCILRNLTLSSDPAANGGRLTVSGEFYSGLTSATKFLPSGSQSIGTATQPGTTYYEHTVLTTKTVSGSAMILDKYSIAFNNKAVRVGADGSGDAQTYALAMNDGYEITGSLRALYDAQSLPFLANSLTSQFDTQIIFAYGSGADPVTTDGDLLFKINGHFNSSPVRDLADEKGVMVDIAFVGADDGTNEMAEVEHANGVDRAW